MNMLYSILGQINSIEALRRPKDGVFLQPTERAMELRQEILDVYTELSKTRLHVFGRVEWNRDQARKLRLLHLPLPSQSRMAVLTSDFFYSIKTEDPINCSEKVEQLRDEGDILSAMHMQRMENLAKMQFYGASSEEYADSRSIFEKLQREFWNNNQQVLEYSPLNAMVPEKLMQPFLHDDIAIPPETYLNNTSLKHRDALGRTPLHTSMEHHVYLKDYNDLQADNNAQDIFGRTPLHIICSLPAFRQAIGLLWSDQVISFVQLSLTRWYLSRDSVDIHVRDCDGRYAVEYAILDRRPQVLRLFRDEYEYFEPESEVGRLVLEALKDMEDLDASFSSSDGM